MDLPVDPDPTRLDTGDETQGRINTESLPSRPRLHDVSHSQTNNPIYNFYLFQRLFMYWIGPGVNYDEGKTAIFVRLFNPSASLLLILHMYQFRAFGERTKRPTIKKRKKRKKKGGDGDGAARTSGSFASCERTPNTRWSGQVLHIDINLSQERRELKRVNNTQYFIIRRFLEFGGNLYIYINKVREFLHSRLGNSEAGGTRIGY